MTARRFGSPGGKSGAVFISGSDSGSGSWKINWLAVIERRVKRRRHPRVVHRQKPFTLSFTSGASCVAGRRQPPPMTASSFWRARTATIGEHPERSLSIAPWISVFEIVPSVTASFSAVAAVPTMTTLSGFADNRGQSRVSVVSLMPAGVVRSPTTAVTTVLAGFVPVVVQPVTKRSAMSARNERTVSYYLESILFSDRLTLPETVATGGRRVFSIHQAAI